MHVDIIHIAGTFNDLLLVALSLNTVIVPNIVRKLCVEIHKPNWSIN